MSAGRKPAFVCSSVAPVKKSRHSGRHPMRRTARRAIAIWGLIPTPAPVRRANVRHRKAGAGKNPCVFPTRTRKATSARNFESASDFRSADAIPKSATTRFPVPSVEAAFAHVDRKNRWFHSEIGDGVCHRTSTTRTRRTALRRNPAAQDRVSSATAWFSRTRTAP